VVGGPAINPIGEAIAAKIAVRRRRTRILF